jgi:hypothetical protein
MGAAGVPAWLCSSGPRSRSIARSPPGSRGHREGGRGAEKPRDPRRRSDHSAERGQARFLERSRRQRPRDSPALARTRPAGPLRRDQRQWREGPAAPQPVLETVEPQRDLDRCDVASMSSFVTIVWACPTRFLAPLSGPCNAVGEAVALRSGQRHDARMPSGSVGTRLALDRSRRRQGRAGQAVDARVWSRVVAAQRLEDEQAGDLTALHELGWRGHRIATDSALT